MAGTLFELNRDLRKKVKKGPKAKKKKVDFPTGEVAKATKKKKRKRAVPR